MNKSVQKKPSLADRKLNSDDIRMVMSSHRKSDWKTIVILGYHDGIPADKVRTASRHQIDLVKHVFTFWPRSAERPVARSISAESCEYILSARLLDGEQDGALCPSLNKLKGKAVSDSWAAFKLEIGIRHERTLDALTKSWREQNPSILDEEAKRALVVRMEHAWGEYRMGVNLPSIVEAAISSDDTLWGGEGI